MIDEKQMLTLKDITNEELSVETPNVEYEKGVDALKKGDTLTVGLRGWTDQGIGYAYMEDGKYVLLSKKQFDGLIKSYESFKEKCNKLELDCSKFESKLKKKKIQTYSKREAQHNQIYILADALDGKRNIEIHRRRGYSCQSIARVLAVSPKPGMTSEEIQECRAKDLARLHRIYDRDDRSIIVGPFDLVIEWYDRKVELILRHTNNSAYEVEQIKKS